MDESALGRLLGEPLDWRAKGFPLDGRFPTIEAVRTARPGLFDDGFVTPIATLVEDALSSNVATMAQFCADRQVLLAPHGKTTMAPQLYQRQLAAGAWGITVATPYQARVCREFGVPRILLANELVDPAAIAWVAEELAQDGAFTFLSYVDSPHQVEASAKILASMGATCRLDVLLEVGYDGGRTGCRNDRQVEDTIRALLDSPFHRVVGVAAYEGLLGHSATPEVTTAVHGLTGRLRSAAEMLDDLDPSRSPEPLILTAGGSAFFDLVVEDLAAPLESGRQVQVILRSGGYVVHDVQLYGEVSPFRRSTAEGLPQLTTAVEVWSRVLSRPEPALAVLDMGKRDVGTDVAFPTPRRQRRAGDVRDADGRWHVRDMNDQHTYLVIGPDDRMEPGDLVSFDISHPCTFFDRWTWIPVVDAHFRVTDVVRTYF